MHHHRWVLIKRIFKCFYMGLVNTIHHDGVEHSGYLAFLSLLAFFPFLVFFVAVAGFLGNLEIGDRFVHIMLQNLPHNLTAALKPRIIEIISGPPQGLLTIAIFGTVWTASSAVEGLRTTLNRAYRVSTPPAYIWRRLLSVLQFIIVTIFALLAMLLLIVGPIAVDHIQIHFGFLWIIEPLWVYLRYAFSIAVLFFAVATAYYALPNVRQRLVWVIPGAAIAVALWLVAAGLLTLYLNDFTQVNLVYGSLGGMIATLLFFYISALILIYGAEVNYLIEKSLGRKFVVKDERVKKPAYPCEPGHE